MLFNHHHPNYAGDVGLGINPKLSAAIANADLVILMGSRFSEVPSQNYQLLGVQGLNNSSFISMPVQRNWGGSIVQTLPFMPALKH